MSAQESWSRQAGRKDKSSRALSGSLLSEQLLFCSRKLTGGCAQPVVDICGHITLALVGSHRQAHEAERRLAGEEGFRT